MSNAAIAAHARFGVVADVNERTMRENIELSYCAAALAEVLTDDQLAEVSANYEKYGTDDDAKKHQSRVFRDMIDFRRKELGVFPLSWPEDY